MIAHKVEDGYVLVLKKDEKLVKSVVDFCIENKIQAGFFSGLGAVQSATVGYYYLKQKRYKFKKINRLVEIASLNGNITKKDGRPFLHAHVVLSDGKLRPMAGHLKEATVGGTCEIHLRVLNTKFMREADESTGLDLIQ